MPYTVVPQDCATVEVQGVNTCLNSTTSPAIFDVPADQLCEYTIWKKDLSVQINKDNGNPATDLAVCPIWESWPGSPAGGSPINQDVDSNGKYTDPVGHYERAGLPRPKAQVDCDSWRNEPVPSFPHATEHTHVQNFDVYACKSTQAGDVDNRKVILKKIPGTTKAKLWVDWQ